MREEHNSVLSTPTEADKIGHFDQHIVKLKYRPIYQPGQYIDRSLVILSVYYGKTKEN